MKPSWQIDDEVLEWYQMTPAERWRESQKLWAFYLSVGGSLDPEPDSESPFDTLFTRRTGAADGRSGMCVIRRG